MQKTKCQMFFQCLILASLSLRVQSTNEFFKSLLDLPHPLCTKKINIHIGFSKIIWFFLRGIKLSRFSQKLFDRSSNKKGPFMKDVRKWFRILHRSNLGLIYSIQLMQPPSLCLLLYWPRLPVWMVCEVAALARRGAELGLMENALKKLHDG